MKKSAPAAGATRIKPSAPTPRCRSQIASMSPASSESRSSTSSIRTKSLPVPLYLPNLISPISQVLRHLVYQLDRPVLAGLEPSYSRVAPEPRRLAAGQCPRALCGAGDRVLQRDRSLQVPGRLSVPDGLPRGEGWTHAAVEQPAGLVEHAALVLRSNSCMDPFPKDLRRHRHAGRPDLSLGIAVPRLREGREGPAGDGGDLEGPHRAPHVRRLDLGGRPRIAGLEAPVQRVRALPLRLVLQGAASGRIGRRELELVGDRAEVEPGAADRERASAARR